MVLHSVRVLQNGVAAGGRVVWDEIEIRKSIHTGVENAGHIVDLSFCAHEGAHLRCSIAERAEVDHRPVRESGILEEADVQ